MPGVTVELVGGLGNQLFIYAAGYELSRKLSCPLYIDTTWFASHSDRTLGIDSFGIDAVFVSSRPLMHRAQIELHKNLPNRFSQNSKIFKESSAHFDKEVSYLLVGSTLRGYFQSWKYFPCYAQEIRVQIANVINPSDWYQKLRTDYESDSRWIALHVRRGDYLNSKIRDLHGIVAVDYYARAIEKIDSQFDTELPLKIFSDDSAAAQTIFRDFKHRIEYIHEPPDSRPIETMLLMSMSSGLITANSSFSWWAAWLGESATRPVVVPDPWFRSKSFNPEDLFLPNWIRLDSALH